MSYRNIVSKLPNYLALDTIQSRVRKYKRIQRLQQFLSLEHITSSSKISGNVKRKITLNSDGITGGFYAPDSGFGFIVLRDNKQDYRFGSFIAYGLMDYTRVLNTKDEEILECIFNICPITSIDVCFDTAHMPIIERLHEFGKVTNYQNLSKTFYINEPLLYGIERVIIYDKSHKDSLKGNIWRIEFILPFYGVDEKHYELPLESINEVISKSVSSRNIPISNQEIHKSVSNGSEPVQNCTN